VSGIREQTNNNPITIFLLNLPTQGFLSINSPIKLGNYSLIVKVKFIAYEKELKKDIVNKN